MPWWRAVSASSASASACCWAIVGVSAEPSMWLSPLPVALKRHMLRAWRGQRSVTLLVPTEPDAEPDPGRFEVPRRVDTACAVITYQETLPRQTPCPLRKGGGDGRGECAMCRPRCAQDDGGGLHIDRKSTRLNSSHSQISYAVF